MHNLINYTRILFSITLICGMSLTTLAQKRLNSCILDSNAYQNTPLAAPLMRGDFDNLPKSYSIKQYTATPQDQGELGNCVGWTAAYMGRSTMLAIKNNWTDQETIDQNALSPFYLYEKIKVYDDIKCEKGATLYSALDALKSIGTVLYDNFSEPCNQEIYPMLEESAKQYKIKDFKRLFPLDTKNKIPFIKKSISEKKPVVIGVRSCFPSFIDATSDIWNIKKEENFDNLDPYEGHALMVVGYNDEKYGGAVEIMNSWGTEWANKGYIWIKYKDFNQFCFEAYELMEQDDGADFAAEVDIKLASGHSMPVKYNKNVYEVTKPFHSGTLFRLQVTNFKPTYLYIFSTDLSKKNHMIFPWDDEYSSYLDYEMSNLAFPNEDHFIELDNTKGFDYFCLLFSRKPLHMPSLLNSIQFADGSFQDRLLKALSLKELPKKKAIFTDNKISFISKDKDAEVIPIIIIIPHI